uniref:Candidate secreted effector n=1 Tax=Meloidogyne incognita TaxID=6306 RepID=A0A914NQ29_MELIC
MPTTTTIINGQQQQHQHQHYHQKPRQRWRKRRNVFTQKKSLTTTNMGGSIKSSSNISPSMLSLSSSSTSLSSSSSGICCSHLSIGSHTAINSSTNNTCWSSSETEVEKNEKKGSCNGKVKVSQQSKIINNNENIKNEELEIIKK